MAAGVIALVLEANPELRWRDVQHITIRNAQVRIRLKDNFWFNYTDVMMQKISRALTLTAFLTKLFPGCESKSHRLEC